MVEAPSTGSRMSTWLPPVMTITEMVAVAVRPAESVATAVMRFRTSGSSGRSATVQVPASMVAGRPLTLTVGELPVTVPVTVARWPR